MELKPWSVPYFSYFSVRGNDGHPYPPLNA